MTDLMDQLWPVFIAEVTEQIDELEKILDSSSLLVQRDYVHALFRHCHTIKSNGSMVDFETIEQTAHACEELLFVFRENELCIDQECKELLVRAVDTLKSQVNHAIRDRKNPPSDDELVSSLVAYAEKIKQPKESATTVLTPHERENEQDQDAVQDKPKEAESETMRVNNRTLDDLVASIGNMAMRENTFSHAMHDEKTTILVNKTRGLFPRMQAGMMAEQEINTLDELLTSIDDCHQRAAHADQSIQVALDRIEQDVLELRVVPIAIVFNRLPVLVTRTSENSRKKVELLIEGADVRIDKRMVDILMEPLVHIIRNAIDHGIEAPEERIKLGKTAAGLITVRAEQDAGMLVLDISDDGAGLDSARIEKKAKTLGLIPPGQVLTVAQIHQLIFLPGFSTSDSVTETSGRGVGMDVVKTRITTLGGRVELVSTAGAGARIRIHLPLSVAIQNVLLVRLLDQTFALPLRAISEIIPARLHELHTVCGQSTLLFRDGVLPVTTLAQLTGQDALLQQSNWANQKHEIVVLRRQDEWLGVLVDHVIGQQELIVREIHPDLSSLPGMAGVSILGDGRAAIILDSEHLFRMAASRTHNVASSIGALS